MILCNHENIAVSLAAGYGLAAGRPMAAIVHNVVGLLNATNAIYNSWLAQAPILILGGTGPMAMERRHPWIDWIHTALVQGNHKPDKNLTARKAMLYSCLKGSLNCREVRCF
jgi:thiamine pyrophosphate-dependent acetolactate synthase large subunit-like protein